MPELYPSPVDRAMTNIVIELIVFNYAFLPDRISTYWPAQPAGTRQASFLRNVPYEVTTAFSSDISQITTMLWRERNSAS